MAKSDTDECCESSCTVDRKNMGLEVDDSVLDKSNDTTIHSGHFMVSCIHDEESDLRRKNGGARRKKKAFDFQDANKATSRTYRFDSRSTIDATLTKLFKCMTLAYSDNRLTSPKWKNFKGIKLPLKDKIRLNNIIWREWHMQYIQGRHATICQFDPPISDKTHCKPEAVVLEGKYWKRRLESVTTEYKKWRLFYRKRFQESAIMEDVCMVDKSAEFIPFGLGDLRQCQPYAMPQYDQYMTDEDFTDLSDTLFTSLNNNMPFAFPNPKELSQLGNADIIQPGLVQLQPNLDDFMDTLEPLPSLQEMITSAMSSKCATPTKDYSQPSTSTALKNIVLDAENLPINTYYPTVKMEMSQQLDTSPSLSSAMFTVPASVSALASTFNQPIGILPARLQLMTTPPQPSTLDIQQIGGMTSTLPRPTDPSLVTSNTGGRAVTELSIDCLIKNNNTPQLLNMMLNSDVGQHPTTIPEEGDPALEAEQTMPQNLSGIIMPPPQETASQNTKTLAIIETTSQLQTLLQSLTQSTRNEQQQQVVQQPTVTVGQVTQPLVTTGQPVPMLRSSTTGMARTATQGSDLRPCLWSDTDLPFLSGKRTLMPSTDIRRASTGSVVSMAGSPIKRNGHFLVPQPKNKTRTIAPAPLAKTNNGRTSKIGGATTQNTFLTQLLTQGKVTPQSDFVGGNICIKTEKSFTATSSTVYPTVKPSTSTTISQTSLSNDASSLSSNYPSVSFSLATGGPTVTDFQRNMLIAATSQAIGIPAHHINAIAVPTYSEQKIEIQSPVGSPQFQVPSPVGSECGSPVHPFRIKNEASRQSYKDNRRASHITAEQKRRCNIKSGFDTLHHLVPSLNCSPNSKVSKAATLQKAVEYCKKLKQDRATMQEEAEILRQEAESLNNAISVCQSQLPATGVPITRQRVNQMREMLDEYICSRTLQNWKFWIFSVIIRPLFDTFNNMVSTTSPDELCRTVLSWLDQHCSLVALRPAVLNSLRHLSTSTSILSDPSRVPEQAAEAVRNHTRDTAAVDSFKS